MWEWRSETYVLKQQGHYYDVAASAFSPDGAYLVTGADDAKVGAPGQATGLGRANLRVTRCASSAAVLLPESSAKAAQNHGIR